jgi:thiamine-phosphate pyrophosphorylase
MPPASSTAPGASRRERLLHAVLYLVVEAEPRGRPPAELLGPALRGGVDMVQLREKGADDARVVAAGREFRGLCDSTGALLFVNDRPDLALACGADGVHLGQDDEDVEAARRLVGGDLLVGLSTHSEGQIDAALGSSCDYVAVGPVHPTATKPDVPAVGLGLVSYAAEHVERPFFAIGGLDATNVGDAAASGASRIAVVRAIRDAADPEGAARGLREAFVRSEAIAAR